MCNINITQDESGHAAAAADEYPWQQKKKKNIIIESALAEAPAVLLGSMDRILEIQVSTASSGEQDNAVQVRRQKRAQAHRNKESVMGTTY